MLDTVDAALAAEVEALGLRAVVADTIMTDDASRARLAATVLDAAGVPYAVADGLTEQAREGALERWACATRSGSSRTSSRA